MPCVKVKPIVTTLAAARDGDIIQFGANRSYAIGDTAFRVDSFVSHAYDPPRRRVWNAWWIDGGWRLPSSQSMPLFADMSRIVTILD